MSNNIIQKLSFIILTLLTLIDSTYSVCNSVNCPPLRGICSENKCICEENYATINNKYIQNNGIFCNYHLKSRFVAFLLEFFFPFGVGHFYSGKTILAVIKLGLLALLFLMCCSVLCCVASKAVNACYAIICIILVMKH